MCEIAILDPERYSNSELKGAAIELYDSMRTSLGMVAVYDTDGRFEYDVYRAMEPGHEEVLSFVEKARDDGALRLIIHGRLATHGEKNIDGCHPIEIDCPKCDVDYVIHNGIVTRHYYDREDHRSEGHEYTTDVDSEVIAHEYGSVPTDFDTDETEHYAREPAYILMNEDAVFIRGTSYLLTRDGRMCRSHRDFGPAHQDEDFVAVIMKPKSE